MANVWMRKVRRTFLFCKFCTLSAVSRTAKRSDKQHRVDSRGGAGAHDPTRPHPAAACGVARAPERREYVPPARAPGSRTPTGSGIPRSTRASELQGAQPSAPRYANVELSTYPSCPCLILPSTRTGSSWSVIDTRRQGSAHLHVSLTILLPASPLQPASAFTQGRPTSVA